jgi:branched-chain amino acid transport system permease protein
VLAALAPLPWLLHSDFWLNLAIMALYYGFLGQAWNLLGGYGGQFSFGHAAFFGTGAYASAVLQVKLGFDPWLAFALAGVLAGCVGAFVGALSFRYGLRGSYFALITLAFAEVLRIVANSVGFTGAGVGTLIPLKQGAYNFQFATKAGFYFVIFGLTALGLAMAWWLENSRFGARLSAVRENEDAARALGVDATLVKIGAMTLSAAIAAAGGCFYAQYYLFIDAGIAYGPWISIEALLAPIVGGVGTVFGPLLGALVVKSLGEATKLVAGDAPGLDLVIYGGVLVLVVAFAPRGIAGVLADLRRLGRRTRRAGALAEADRA